MKYLLTETHCIGEDSNADKSTDLPERTVIQVEVNNLGEYEIDPESINYDGERFVATPLTSGKKIVFIPTKTKGHWQNQESNEIYNRSQDGDEEITFKTTDDQPVPKTLVFKKLKF